jgi:hypothetical protein
MFYSEGAATLSITTFSIMAFGIRGFIATLSMNNMLSVAI